MAGAQQRDRSDGRRMADGSFTVVATTTRGSASTLKSPQLLAANDSIAVVYDYGDGLVKAFGAKGQSLWTSGRSAGSPPLSNPTDLQLTPASEIWLLDGPSRRVAIWNASGGFVRTFTLNRNVTRFRVIGADLWAANVAGASVWYRFTHTGQLVDSIATASYLANVPEMAREGWVTTAGDGRLVVAHLYGGALAIGVPAARQFQVRAGVEPVPFGTVSEWPGPGGGIVKRMSAAATRATVSLTGDASQAFALFVGATPHARRIVDVYDMPAGTYRHSLLLPTKAHLISRTPSGFWILSGGDLPLLQLVHWQPR